MNEKIRWVKLTRAQVSEQMLKLGVKVSRNIVRKLMKKHKLVKRKMQRKKACGKSMDRNEQFNKITEEKNKFLKSQNPIISIDTKKKEDLGELHRKGSVYCTQAIESFDHDYPYLSDGKFIPHGIYDVKQNKAHINLGVSCETAEFVCDSIGKWWDSRGIKEYSRANKILILCDAGGANSYRHNIFKVELQKLSNKINMKLQIAHYPPYASKWNPIEHRVFPHVTRSIEGVLIKSVEEAKNIIKTTTTKTGLKVTTGIIKKNYETGKEVAKDFMKTMKIKFDECLGKFNYLISPFKA
jgi:hypothetical protein